MCWVLPALLDGVSPQQRVDDGVDGLLQVLYQDGVSSHHSLFYHIYVAGATVNNIRLMLKCSSRAARGNELELQGFFCADVSPALQEHA